ncbi:RNA polymerase sigma factor [Nonomuraea sp. NEAU-A123]|uniref:RNA polymerase sigma factor n=1 Tax=Nonomuraea sp. NEAU-A123 TaxID=2839649 RepID=UPI001BE41A76|nr:RNA polymerase sigma factor [Nonomuraea sp. NEAU-A123]MBT2229951.1 RNA polymerase sigma factor [Nonomuraea sp. NEAU-A123]
MRRFPFSRREPPDVGPDSTDAELIAAIAAESVTALRLLHHRHVPWLRARLARRCADPDAVDDALQDTFLAVWKTARRFDGGNPAGWLWTIAMRRLVSALRGRGSHRLGGDPVERRAAERRAIERQAVGRRDGRRRGFEERAVQEPVNASAEDVALLGVEHGDLGAALNRLSPELRAVIQATVLDGLTVKQASRLLGVPEGTIKTRAMRARARLREELA